MTVSNWRDDDPAVVKQIDDLIRDTSRRQWLDLPVDDGWALPEEEPLWSLDDEKPAPLRQFTVRDETGNGGTFQMTDDDAALLAKRPGWTVTRLDDD